MELPRSPRELILARVREALRVPTDPVVKAHSSNTGPNPNDGTSTTLSIVNPPAEWLPAGGVSPDQRKERFREHSARLKTRFCPVRNISAALAELRLLCRHEQWNLVGAHHHPLVDALCQGLELPVCRTDGGYDPLQLESCQVGITCCEALIAQTGSILVSSLGCGGRALSVLPPHHVVIASSEQLLPDMLAGFAHLRTRYGSDFPSFTSFITGPSRTGDIERILVLGAHGPRQLTVILLEEPFP